MCKAASQNKTNICQKNTYKTIYIYILAAINEIRH